MKAFFDFAKTLQERGGDVLVRWDGLRQHDVCTITFTCQGFTWRKDGEDIEQLMIDAMEAWKASSQGAKQAR